MIKVSIIIPVYNVEKYLEKCLASCVNQTLEEIEVIVVNDASPDASDQIMKRFEKEYPTKIVNIFLTQNLRQGGARNIGINLAQGKYLCFVDGDDFLDKTMCQKLYTKCEEEKLDIACCDGFLVYGDKKVYWERFKTYDFVKKNSLEHFTGQCYMIIRKNLIRENNLFYPEHTFHEDSAVVPVWYLMAEKIGFLREPLYFQNRHSDSASARVNFNLMQQVLQTLWVLIENAERMEVYAEHKDKVDCFVLVRICYVAKNILKIKEKLSISERKMLEEEVHRWKGYNFNETLLKNHLSWGEHELVKRFLNEYESYFEDSWEMCNKNIINIGYPEQEEKLIELIKVLEAKGKNIVLWGAGQKGKILFPTMRKIGGNYVVGDNAPSCWNQKLLSGDIIRSADWVLQYVQEPIFLITATRLYHEIVEELKRKFDVVIAIDLFAYLEYDLTVEELFEE